MNDDFDDTSEPELTADEEALLEEMPALTGVGQTRRTFLGQTIAGGLGFFAARPAGARAGVRGACALRPTRCPPLVPRWKTS